MLGDRCAICGREGNLMFCAKDVNETSEVSKMWTSSKAAVLAELERTILLCDGCYWTRIMASDKRPKFQHGTLYAYRKKKCRCDLCVNAHREHTVKRRGWRQRRYTRVGSSTG